MLPNAPDRSREIVITFEDLYGRGQLMGPLPRGYAGFTWSESAWFMTREYSSSVRPGHAALFNAHGEDLFFEREHPFGLKELSLSLLWMSTIEIMVEGWEKGMSKFAETATARKNAAIRLKLDFRDVDRVGLKSGGDHVVIHAVTVVFKEV